MKKYCLVLFMIFAVLVSSAQEQRLPSPRKKQKTEAKTDDSKGGTQAAITASDYNILRNAVENAFLVVQQSYNIRKNGVLVDAGGEFYGQSYSILPLLKYGYGVDKSFSEPWMKDSRYRSEYGSCSDCVAHVDRILYKRLSDKGDYQPFKLEDRISDTLAPTFFHVREDFFNNKGLNVQVGNGVKSGYMIWFMGGEKNVYFSIVPMIITFNENLIFSLEQPADKNIIGGFFLNVNVSEPGVVTLDILGAARLDPYTGEKWELVKMLKRPVSPDGENSKKTETSDSKKNKRKGKK